MSVESKSGQQQANIKHVGCRLKECGPYKVIKHEPGEHSRVQTREECNINEMQYIYTSLGHWRS